MDANRRKQLKDQYKSKLTVGAVYAIECSGNGKRCVKCTTDIDGLRNRFQLSMSINGCPDPAVRSDWEKYGTESFSLVVLDELKQKEDQSAAEFAQDIKVLREMWLEKSDAT